MPSILDDEYVIQLEDSPPFSWLAQSPDRVINCGRSLSEESIVHAQGNAYTSAMILNEMIDTARFKLTDSFSLLSGEEHVFISYSGENEEAIRSIKENEKPGTLISTGGNLKRIAREKGWAFYPLPKGLPARFAFPEVLGCLIDSRVKYDRNVLGEKITSLSPTIPTEENEAKRIALNLKDDRICIVYDQGRKGIARRFQEDLIQNAKLLSTTLDKKEADFFFSESDIANIYFTDTNGPNLKGAVRIELSNTIEDAFYGTILSAYISIYKAMLKNMEIILIDRYNE